MLKPLLLMTLLASSVSAMSQTLIPLYAGKIPNSKNVQDQEVKNVDQKGQIRYSKVSKPTLQIFLPPAGKANGAAVVIIPGGGYGIVAYTHEGIDIATQFNKMGVAAFVLKYRLPSDATMEDKSIGPLQDAQQAIKTVRDRASEWGVDTSRVGIIGFSAGGHLASTAGTHFNQETISNKEHTNLRPDFMILGYPVISLTDSLMHKGSRDNLLGPSPTAEQVNSFSNELQVSKQTPPTFLLHAGDDKAVKVGNSIRFYEALLRNQVPAEMHIYPKGGHGFGLNNQTTPDRWMERVENWMRSNNWIK
jgi:acetyl esterase/lipase